MRTARLTVMIASTLVFAASAIAYGCGGGDDSVGAGAGGDSGAGDDGSSFDATAADSSTRDSGSRDTGTADTGVDSGPVDAGPPAHVVFLTTSAFDGNLIAAAGDGGMLSDGGVSAIAAADSLCQAAADAAHVTGTFHAVINSHLEDGTSRFQDSDGPWALVDGTPFAETASDLVSGKWHTSLDLHADGTTTGSNFVAIWANRNGSTLDCQAWSTNDPSDGGFAGSVGVQGFIGPDALGDSNIGCESSALLVCAQVGAGGGANRYPTIPVGGKIAFVTKGTNPGGFATEDAGTDGGAPPGADGAHQFADLSCNVEAHAAGLTGNFHAFISTSGADALTYFTSLSMNGPWYRPDGFELASSRADLVSSTSLHTQLALSADDTFASTLGAFTWTATNGGGSLAGNNCAGFTDSTSAHSGIVAIDELKGPEGLEDFVGLACNFSAKFYCFQQ